MIVARMMNNDPTMEIDAASKYFVDKHIIMQPQSSVFDTMATRELIYKLLYRSLPEGSGFSGAIDLSVVVSEQTGNLFDNCGSST